MKTNLDKLVEWFENEKKNNGLLDIKIFPKKKYENIELLAEEILHRVTVR